MHTNSTHGVLVAMLLAGGCASPPDPRPLPACLSPDDTLWGQILVPTACLELSEEPGGAPTPIHTEVGDVDGDGHADVVVGDHTLRFGPLGAAAPRQVSLPFDHPPFLPPPTVVGLGDVDGDGRAEVGTRGTDDLPVRWASWVDGELVEGHHLEVDGLPHSLGDVDGDGLDDLLVHDATPDEGRDEHWLSFHQGIYDGPEHWGVEVMDADRRSDSLCVSAGDVNGDGHADVLLGCGAGPLAGAELHLGGPAGITWESSFRTDLGPGRIVRDLDGDGLDDVVLRVDGEDASWLLVLQGRSCPGDLDCDGEPSVSDCAVRAGLVHRDAVELCDGEDNDCDGQIDEGLGGWPSCLRG